MVLSSGLSQQCNPSSQANNSQVLTKKTETQTFWDEYTPECPVDSRSTWWLCRNFGKEEVGPLGALLWLGWVWKSQILRQATYLITRLQLAIHLLTLRSTSLTPQQTKSLRKVCLGCYLHQLQKSRQQHTPSDFTGQRETKCWVGW